MEAEGLSPLVFPSAPRGRGRPKTKNQRQGAPIAPRCLKRKAFSFVPDCLAQYEIQPAPKKGQRAVKTNKLICWWISWHSSDTTHTCRVGCKSWGRLVYWLWWLLWHMRIPFQRSHQSQKNDNQVQGMLEKCPQTVYRERWLYLSVIDNP